MSALESAKIVGITEEKINFGTVETLASELQSYADFCMLGQVLAKGHSILEEKVGANSCLIVNASEHSI